MVSENVRKAVLERIASGEPMTQIAESLECPVSTCYHLARRAGVEPPTRARRTSLEADAHAGFKTCLECGEDKPLSDYAPCARSAGGVEASCKDCKYQRRGRGRRFKPPVLSLAPVLCAYLAGLIDADGCITLAKTTRAEIKIGYSYVPLVSIAMTGSQLRGVYDEVGIGNFHFRTTHPNPHAKPIHAWNISANGIRALLPLVAPHLRFKGRQAALVLEYLSLNCHQHTRSEDLMARFYEKADAIYAKMRALNATGVRK